MLKFGDNYFRVNNLSEIRWSDEGDEAAIMQQANLVKVYGPDTDFKPGYSNYPEDELHIRLFPRNTVKPGDLIIITMNKA